MIPGIASGDHGIGEELHNQRGGIVQVPSLFFQGKGMDRICVECGKWIPDTVRTKTCSDHCRDRRKIASTGSLYSRFAALRRCLVKENVPPTDKLYSLNFYEQLVLDGCVYCSGPLSPSGHGLDRINNDLGHRCYNVVVACGFCNGIKGDRLTWDEIMILAPGLKEIRERRELAALKHK